MSLAEIFAPGRFGLSFELFPPKTAATEKSLWEAVEELAKLRPDFMTCTYGAGGSTREKTLDICEGVKKRFGLAVASHLTCVGSTVDQLRAYLTEAGRRGVDHIVSLRGDPPRGETSFQAVEGGLRYANELTALIHREFPQFGIAVAGYPEKHLEAPDMETDLANLKRKVEAGGQIVVTQLYYDNADFFRFRDRCEALGIRAPIVPGILPVTNFAQIQRITSLCGARLPKEFASALEACADDPQAQHDTGVRFAVKQVRELVAAGIPGIHFYVLNRSSATAQVLREAGIR